MGEQVDQNERIPTYVPPRPVRLDPPHESWLPKEHTLYRPRHGSRQLTARICALTFLFLPLVLLIVGVRPEQIENRRLTLFPSLAAGWGFFTGFNPWATDHVPLRGEAVGVEDWVSRQIFGEPPKLGDQGTNQGPVQGPVAPSEGDKDRDRVRANGFPKVIEGSDGWMYLGYDMLGACLPEKPLTDVIDSLRRLRSVVESSGRKFVLVVAPDKTTVVPEHLPPNHLGDACSKQARLNFWYQVVRNVGDVDLRPALLEAGQRRGAPVYSKVDSHWTFEGGVVMTRALAEAIDPGVTASWRVTPGSVVTHTGDLPPLIGKQIDYPVQNFDLAPDGTTVRSKALATDFREPVNIGQSSGAGVVNAKIGMVADSFSLYAGPYLAGGFSDLEVTSLDTFAERPAAIADMLADKDVIVVETVERSLLGGISPLVQKENIDAIQAALAKKPR